MSSKTLLLTGATGYVGGTVLTHLLESNVQEIKDLKISVLVRQQEQAEVYATKGINAILFQGLNDTQALRKSASEHDIVIHTADSTNPEAVEGLILGLVDRMKVPGQSGSYIHLSGTSSLGDYPITKTLVESQEFIDTDDIYGYMKQREQIHTYTQRKTDIKTIEIGQEVGVSTYIIKAPRIYGRGTGLYNAKSAHIPWLINGAVACGQAEIIGDGSGIWDDVHVSDLADLFELIVGKILKGESLPSGAKGLYFAATLRHSWKQLAEGISKAGFERGQLKSTELKQLTLEEAAQKYTGGDLLTAVGQVGDVDVVPNS